MMENWNSSENDTSNEMSGSGEPYTPILSGQALVYKEIISKKDMKFIHKQQKRNFEISA